MKDPDIFGMVAIPLDHTDPRWEAVRDLTVNTTPPDLPVPAPTVVGNIHMIDAWVNGHVAYQADLIDAWAPPSATMTRRLGDCEDYALLKRQLLIQSGVAPDRLYLLLVWDKIARRDHALLAVDTEVAPNRPPQFLILDSFNALGLPEGQVSDYLPMMAFCEGSAWAYGRRVVGAPLKV